MDNTDLRQKLGDIAGQRIAEGWFPGCVIGVLWKNGDRLIVPVGKFTDKPDAPMVTENSIYDMASVTKAIPTACLLLKLIDDAIVKIDDPVVAYVPALKIKERNNILIRHLLEFTLNYSNPEYSALGIKYKSADEILNYLFTSELAEPPGTSNFYTGATATFTGLVVEHVMGKPLDVAADEVFFHPLGMASTAFRPEKLSRKDIVPSEIDPWRGREICAEVHDESSWTLRKDKNMCIGAAGLFSSAPDMLNFLEMLLQGGMLKGKRYFSEGMVEQMHVNHLASIGECHGWGWRMEKEWMGSRHSKNAFGATGFTGTAVFCDPGQGVGVTILSNGIYPTRERAQKEVLRDKFRAEVLDIILEPGTMI